MYSAKLTKIVEEFQLEAILPEIDIAGRVITRKEINRPALQLTGFYHRFDNDRLQIIGRVEHGYLQTLNDIYGEGVLITGASGIGKSEPALELIKRGHRLIADDAVEIKKIADQTLVGTCPELIRYLIELRGIGVINVKELFGIGAVKQLKSIDLVIKLEIWDGNQCSYDRLGLSEEYIEILGNKVLCNTIPIRPGRNVAVICESAAISNRQKKMGTSTAVEFENKILQNNRSTE